MSAVPGPLVVKKANSEKLAEYIQAEIAKAPPLSANQCDKLTALLRGRR